MSKTDFNLNFRLSRAAAKCAVLALVPGAYIFQTTESASPLATALLSGWIFFLMAFLAAMTVLAVKWMFFVAELSEESSEPRPAD